MTIPPRLRPVRPTRSGPDLVGNFLVDPLPKSVLHQLVADLPGPKDETETARAARFEAQLAEVLSYRPRNAAEAMLATHCILFRLVADDARADASRTCSIPAEAHQHLRSARQFDRLIAKSQRTLADFQARPSGIPDPVMSAALGLSPVLAPDPGRSIDDAEEAFSAIIVPLHPAPKTLQ
jgi:hypothetical protein